MRPTRLSTLLGLGVLATVVAYVLARAFYDDLPPLPRYAPATLVLLAVFELGLARVVRDRVRGGPLVRPRARALHPLQVARAAALAKASSATGAVLTGVYGGLLAHVLPLQADQPREDAVVAAVSCLAALGLAAAALLLERACRTPDMPPTLET